jgi:peptide deformylase
MIITNNEEALRVKCEDVLPDEIAVLRSVLEAELENSNRLGRAGIGLACPQIGIPKKMAIVRMGNAAHPELNMDLVNASISNAYDQIMVRDEGCLSFPGRVENTLRHQEIHIANNLTTPNSFIATGMLAVCIQHELDHLNQVLFMDRKAPTTPTKLAGPKLAPNDLCFCGRINLETGRPFKYKKCCALR